MTLVENNMTQSRGPRRLFFVRICRLWMMEDPALQVVSGTRRNLGLSLLNKVDLTSLLHAHVWSGIFLGDSMSYEVCRIINLGKMTWRAWPYPFDLPFRPSMCENHSWTLLLLALVSMLHLLAMDSNPPSFTPVSPDEWCGPLQGNILPIPRS